jgi:dehydrogenase/reductase SDR family protein 1
LLIFAAVGTLDGKVAVVTGASRGVGKGIALGLGEAGATVYVTGRSLDSSDDDRGSLRQTAQEIDKLSGKGIAARCDHAVDDQVKAVFDRVRTEQGRLDLLVNNVMSTPQPSELPPGVATFWELHPFWEMPVKFWDSFHNVGLRSHYVASAFAAPLMIETGGALIVCISSGGAIQYAGNVAYGVGKAALEKLVADMAVELRPHNVASISVWPGFTRTEDVVGDPKRYADISRSAAPIFNGRAVAALAADPRVMEKTGTHITVKELADEYGFSDSPESNQRAGA